MKITAIVLSAFLMSSQSAKQEPRPPSNSRQTDLVDRRAPIDWADLFIQQPPTTNLVFSNGANKFVLSASNMDKIDEATLTFDQDGQKIGRLSDEEYKRLTDAEAALAKVKADIAQAHGANLKTYELPTIAPICTETCGVQYHFADTVEFRGHFILINVPEAK